MEPIHAYARGCLVKLAEHNVSPQAFVHAAARSQHPDALKIARVLVEYEKVSNLLADTLGRAGKRVGQFADNVSFGRQGRQNAQGAIGQWDELGHAGQMRHISQNPAGVADKNTVDAARQLVSDQNRAMAGGAGLTVAGAGGLYGSGNADTTGNKIRGALGMDQKSRFSNMLG
jgi:hypothetical protein